MLACECLKPLPRDLAMIAVSEPGLDRLAATCWPCACSNPPSSFGFLMSFSRSNESKSCHTQGFTRGLASLKRRYRRSGGRGGTVPSYLPHNRVQHRVYSLHVFVHAICCKNFDILTFIS